MPARALLLSLIISTIGTAHVVAAPIPVESRVRAKAASSICSADEGCFEGGPAFLDGFAIDDIDSQLSTTHPLSATADTSARASTVTVVNRASAAATWNDSASGHVELTGSMHETHEAGLACGASYEPEWSYSFVADADGVLEARVDDGDSSDLVGVEFDGRGRRTDVHGTDFVWPMLKGTSHTFRLFVGRGAGGACTVWDFDQRSTADWAIHARTLLFGIGGDAAAPQLLLLDSADGAGTPFAGVDALLKGPYGLAYDQYADTLWAVAHRRIPSSPTPICDALTCEHGELFAIEPATGSIQAIGSLGVWVGAPGVAFDPIRRTLYVARSGDDGPPGSDGTAALLTVDTSSGVATLVGALGRAAGGMGIAYDVATDTLYAVATTSDSNGGPSPSTLFTIDRVTGLAGPVLATYPGRAFAGLEFDPGTRRLYASDITPGDNGLYTIDPASFAAMRVGSIGFGDVTGLAIRTRLAVCGDGALDAGEECDDGNLAPGDCCSSSCRIEPSGTTCVDDFNSCTTDQCDAGGSCTHVPGDADGDGAIDCVDGCPTDPGKTDPGQCGCGTADGDTDADGVPDCIDRGQDLAIVKVVAPASVTLTARKPLQTKRVTVQIQNRGPNSERVPDLDTLERLVSLTVQSLGTCAAPTAIVVPPKTFPLVIKSKAKVTVAFDVALGCVNDPAKNGKGSLGHEDYAYAALVTRGAIDGLPDLHTSDDACPRSVAPPFEIDANPDGTIKDRGCGTAKPDKTFGGPVITDVTAK